MGERVAFIIPETMEEAIWTVPCISQYLLNRLVTERAVDKAYAFCPIVELHSLFRSCWKGMEVKPLSELTKEIRNEVDLMFEFDAAKAYELTYKAKKHIVEAYGILLGTVALSLLPAIVSGEKEDPGKVVVVDRHDRDSLYSLDDLWDKVDEFVAMGKAFGIPVDRLPSLPYEQYREELQKASVIVGVRSSGTLIGACLGKGVMELSPELFGHKAWMGKWENKKYSMVHGNLKEMNPIFIWERTRALVEQNSQREVKQWERRSFSRQEVVG